MESLDSLKAEALEATMDMIKSGVSDKFTHYENKKNEMNGMIDFKSEQLRRMIMLEVSGLYGFGLFYVYSNGILFN